MKGMPATFLMAGCTLAGIARAQTDESLLVGSAWDATPLHLEGAALVYPVIFLGARIGDGYAGDHPFANSDAALPDTGRFA
jgi:hypothetical protein